MPWKDHAACAGMGPRAFFPDSADHAARGLAEEVCRGCTVRAECRAYAESEHIVDGIWGGTIRSVARDRTERGIRRSSKTLTAAERAWFAEIIERRKRTA